MADVKWIKICTDIFNDEKMILIESLPEADGIIVIWFKLLCMAGKQNNGGVFMMNDKIAYTDEMLATIFRKPINTVRLALATFEQYGMIEIVNNAITIPNWEKHQSLDKLEQAKEKTRLRVAKHREKQKLLTECNVTVTECNADRIDKEEDKDKDIEKEKKEKKKPAKHTYGEYHHVLLTDKEYENLATDYGVELRGKAISFLDEYIEEKGYKSKSHNLAIRRWVIEAVQEKERKGPKTQPKYSSYNADDALEKALNRSYSSPKTAGEDEAIRKRAEALKAKLS